MLMITQTSFKGISLYPASSYCKRNAPKGKPFITLFSASMLKSPRMIAFSYRV